MSAANPIPGGFADHRAEVVAVAHHPWPYFTVTMTVPASFGRCRPGQFVMTLAGFQLEPYLRRAFSVFDQRQVAVGWEIEIFGKVIGPGTRGLAELEPGARIPVLGPLGRGFRALPTGERRAALVAGGIGSAALLLWARELTAGGATVDVLYGGYGPTDLALADRFREAVAAGGGELILATENGGEGHRGFITEPLEEGLRQGRYGALYTCGPEGLMERVATLGAEYGVPGQAALETEMGCGYGACLGCAVAHVDGRYRLCCKDGPVFDLAEVVW